MNKLSMKNKKKSYKTLWITGLVLLIAITAIKFYGTKDPNENTNQTSSGDLLINKSELSNEAKFYPYEAKGVEMEVLAFTASDGTVRTALNTCQVCQNSGRGYYVQEGNELVCQNCGNRFKADDVEVIRGGCNPVPILKENKIEDETTITIREEFLASSVGLFENWK